MYPQDFINACKQPVAIMSAVTMAAMVPIQALVMYAAFTKFSNIFNPLKKKAQERSFKSKQRFDIFSKADCQLSVKLIDFLHSSNNYKVVGDMDASQPAQVRSAAACAAICDSYPDCTAWTFNVKSGSCWTKDKKPALSASPDAITGTCKASTK
ncbi:unnamed protein product [Adineta steineri]|uniref:Apple domain-containing protein n=1 Tax=Adineta steineri TaxID=433720 RepID=A0A815MH82_9BILA|nr:unnamed protein product [Adineta steineri]